MTSQAPKRFVVAVNSNEIKTVALIPYVVTIPTANRFVSAVFSSSLFHPNTRFQCEFSSNMKDKVQKMKDFMKKQTFTEILVTSMTDMLKDFAFLKAQETPRKRDGELYVEHFTDLEGHFFRATQTSTLTSDASQFLQKSGNAVKMILQSLGHAEVCLVMSRADYADFSVKQSDESYLSTTFGTVKAASDQILNSRSSLQDLIVMLGTTSALYCLKHATETKPDGTVHQYAVLIPASSKTSFHTTIVWSFVSYPNQPYGSFSIFSIGDTICPLANPIDKATSIVAYSHCYDIVRLVAMNNQTLFPNQANNVYAFLQEVDKNSARVHQLLAPFAAPSINGSLYLTSLVYGQQEPTNIDWSTFLSTDFLEEPKRLLFIQEANRQRDEAEIEDGKSSTIATKVFDIFQFCRPRNVAIHVVSDAHHLSPGPRIRLRGGGNSKPQSVKVEDIPTANVNLTNSTLNVDEFDEDMREAMRELLAEPMPIQRFFQEVDVDGLFEELNRNLREALNVPLELEPIFNSDIANASFDAIPVNFFTNGSDAIQLAVENNFPATGQTLPIPVETARSIFLQAAAARLAYDNANVTRLNTQLEFANRIDVINERIDQLRTEMRDQITRNQQRLAELQARRNAAAQDAARAAELEDIDRELEADRRENEDLNADADHLNEEAAHVETIPDPAEIEDQINDATERMRGGGDGNRVNLKLKSKLKLRSSPSTGNSALVQDFTIGDTRYILCAALDVTLAYDGNPPSTKAGSVLVNFIDTNVKNIVLNALRVYFYSGSTYTFTEKNVSIYAYSVDLINGTAPAIITTSGSDAGLDASAPSGSTGNNGHDAGNITMQVMDGTSLLVDQKIKFVLNGGRGGPGRDGGAGGTGSNGADGNGWDKRHNGNNGANGAKGGTGQTGGSGGKGGKGGTLNVIMTNVPGNINNQFLSVSGGGGGDGANGGPGGAGGSGGRGNKGQKYEICTTSGSFRTCLPSWGDNGKNGSAGPQGDTGAHGNGGPTGDSGRSSFTTDMTWQRLSIAFVPMLLNHVNFQYFLMGVNDMAQTSSFKPDQYVALIFDYFAALKYTPQDIQKMSRDGVPFMISSDDVKSFTTKAYSFDVIRRGISIGTDFYGGSRDSLPIFRFVWAQLQSSVNVLKGMESIYDGLQTVVTMNDLQKTQTQAAIDKLGVEINTNTTTITTLVTNMSAWTATIEETVESIAQLKTSIMNDFDNLENEIKSKMSNKCTAASVLAVLSSTLSTASFNPNMALLGASSMTSMAGLLTPDDIHAGPAGRVEPQYLLSNLHAVDLSNLADSNISDVFAGTVSFGADGKISQESVIGTDMIVAEKRQFDALYQQYFSQIAPTQAAAVEKDFNTLLQLAEQKNNCIKQYNDAVLTIKKLLLKNEELTQQQIEYKAKFINNDLDIQNGKWLDFFQAHVLQQRAVILEQLHGLERLFRCVFLKPVTVLRDNLNALEGFEMVTGNVIDTMINDSTTGFLHYSNAYLDASNFKQPVNTDPNAPVVFTWLLGDVASFQKNKKTSVSFDYTRNFVSAGNQSSYNKLAPVETIDLMKTRRDIRIRGVRVFCNGMHLPATVQNRTISLKITHNGTFQVQSVDDDSLYLFHAANSISFTSEYFDDDKRTPASTVDPQYVPQFEVAKDSLGYPVVKYPVGIFGGAWTIEILNDNVTWDADPSKCSLEFHFDLSYIIK